MRVSNFKLGIGIPCSWSHIPFDTVMSLLRMERPDFQLIPACNGPVDGLRNTIVKTALEMGCTHLIMLDMDQTYPVDMVPRLLGHGLPIVGCQVHRRYPPFDPMLFRGQMGSYYPVSDDEIAERGLVSIDTTGAGSALMVETWVYREIEPPWYKFQDLGIITPAGVPVGAGEDFWFCHLVRSRDIPIYIDTSLKAGHLSNLEITEETYYLWKAVTAHKERMNQHGL
jgi:hypothetical protein